MKPIEPMRVVGKHVRIKTWDKLPLSFSLDPHMPLAFMNTEAVDTVTLEDAVRFAEEVKQREYEDAKGHFDRKYDRFTEGQLPTYREQCRNLEIRNGKLDELVKNLRSAAEARTLEVDRLEGIRKKFLERIATQEKNIAGLWIEKHELHRKLEILQKPVYGLQEPPYIDDPLHAKNLRRDVDRHTRLGEKLEKKVNSLDARFAERFAANPNDLLRLKIDNLENSLICANKRINDLENEVRDLLRCDLPKRVAKLEKQE